MHLSLICNFLFPPPWPLPWHVSPLGSYRPAVPLSHQSSNPNSLNTSRTGDEEHGTGALDIVDNWSHESCWVHLYNTFTNCYAPLWSATPGNSYKFWLHTTYSMLLTYTWEYMSMVIGIVSYSNIGFKIHLNIW